MNEVIINTYLAGVRRFIAGAQAEAAALQELGLATKRTGLEMEHAGKRGFILNQALFTMRRLAYGTTLAFLAGGIAALKWGQDYNTAIQGARVALGPFFKDSGDLQRNLDQLWTIAKYSPFQIKDMTMAFAKMAPPLKQLGFTGDDVTRTLKDLTDALSVGMAGRVTPAALNRASVALQHLAFIGRLTGMSVLQLARDGLPIYAALRKELGLTADQMHNVGKMGIPATVAIQALQHYIETTPGYMNAAQRLSNKTFTGLFSQLKDNIAKSMGDAEKGWFHGFQGMLVTVNNFFTRLQQNQKKTTDIWHALDMTISPSSHRFLHIFNLINRAIHDLIGILKIIFNMIVTNKPLLAFLYIILWSTSWIIHIIYVTLRFVNPVLKYFIGLWIALEIVIAINNFRLKIYYFWMRQIIIWEFRWAAIMKRLIFLQGLWNIAMGKMPRNAAGQFRALTMLEKAVLRLRFAVLGLWAAFLESGPIGWLIGAVLLLTVGMVILYFKWKAFHDLVNRFATWLYAHPYFFGLVPVIGWTIFLVVILTKHFKTLVHWAKELAHWFGVIWKHIPGHALFGRALRFGGSLLGIGGGGGGAGTPPHAMRQPHPGDKSNLLKMPGGIGGPDVTGMGSAGLADTVTVKVYPQVINLDGRKIAEVVAKHQTAVNARR